MDFDDIKSTIFTIILIALIGLGGYWAFSTMESGSSHLDNQKVSNLENEIESLKKENKNLKEEINKLNENLTKTQEEKSEVEAEKEEVKNNLNTETTTKTATTTVSKSYKYQSLIDELQKLVDANVYMKKGSTGSRVGTVQKFLNIYNRTSNKIDNDYGNATVIAVKNFQRKEGLTADGNAGHGTFKRMISILKTK